MRKRTSRSRVWGPFRRRPGLDACRCGGGPRLPQGYSGLGVRRRAARRSARAPSSGPGRRGSPRSRLASHSRLWFRRALYRQRRGQTPAARLWALSWPPPKEGPLPRSPRGPGARRRRTACLSRRYRAVALTSTPPPGGRRSSNRSDSAADHVDVPVSKTSRRPGPTTARRTGVRNSARRGWPAPL